LITDDTLPSLSNFTQAYRKDTEEGKLAVKEQTMKLAA
jgi:hypothetical protein